LGAHIYFTSDSLHVRSPTLVDMSNIRVDKALSDQFIIPSNEDIGATAVPEGNGELLRYITFISLSSGHPADQRCTYLCGNSLGPLNKRSKALLQDELHVCGTRYVLRIPENCDPSLITVTCLLTYFLRTKNFQSRRRALCAPLWPRVGEHHRYSHPFARRFGG